LAASFTIAWLSALGECVSLVAATPAPAPPTASAAAAPAITFRLIAIYELLSVVAAIAAHETSAA
jgi:hypothetical protein